ncbi:hypothetical protein CLM62_09470 [Streptomyces sp. SA15]|nr:hypothetical protein CLM62_09470 [Streptomyces sp. SA15]
MLLWAVLVPLFETLIEPIRVRAAGPTKTIDDQRRVWSSIEERYRLLGIAGDALEAFRLGGGWHRLDRHRQQYAAALGPPRDDHTIHGRDCLIPTTRPTSGQAASHMINHFCWDL